MGSNAILITVRREIALINDINHFCNSAPGHEYVVENRHDTLNIHQTISTDVGEEGLDDETFDWTSESVVKCYLPLWRLFPHRHEDMWEVLQSEIEFGPT